MIPRHSHRSASPEHTDEAAAHRRPELNMRNAFVIALIALLAVACAHQTAPGGGTASDTRTAADPHALYEKQTFTAADGTIIPYRLLRPATLTAGRTYPLVILFHGSGAIGTDNVSQLGMLAKQWASPMLRDRYPAFVAVPQFPTRSAVYRDAGTPAASSTATPSLHAGLALIDELVRTLPVDRQRIYAIGFSMGGSAVWNAMALRPELFRAAVAVAGVPNSDALLHGSTRLLLVHGDADVENPFTATARVYEGARNPRLELWPYRGLAHDFPPELLANTAIADWLFRD